MRFRYLLITPLFLASLMARADVTYGLPQPAMAYPWGLPYGWPQMAAPQARPPTFPSMPQQAPTSPAPVDPRSLAALAQPQGLDALVRLMPLMSNPAFVDGLLKLATVASDPRTAEGFMKLAAAMTDPRTLDTLSRLVAAMSDPRFAQAVAVLTDPKVVAAGVNAMAVLGSAVASTPPAP